MKRLLAMIAAFLGGASMVMQSRVNGELGSQLGSGYVAALISFGGGLLILLVAAAVNRRTHIGIRRTVQALRAGTIPWWYLTGGLVGAWYVMSQGLTVGLLGVAAFTVGGVTGQTISGMLVDRMGFGVLKPRAITLNRIAGAALAIVAVSLTVLGDSDQVGGQIWLLILPFIGGCLQPFQQGMAGAIRQQSQDAVTPALANFATGTAALTVVCGVLLAGGHRVGQFPADWRLYVGGLFGAIFIAVAAVVVQRLGTLLMSLLLIAGQVVTALVIDLLLPAAGHPVTIWSFVSAALLLGAVAISSIRRHPLRRARS